MTSESVGANENSQYCEIVSIEILLAVSFIDVIPTEKSLTLLIDIAS